MKINYATFEDKNKMKGGYLAICLSPMPMIFTNHLEFSTCHTIKIENFGAVWGKTR
jgi:hypothetical protein